MALYNMHNMMYGIGIGGLIFRWVAGALFLTALILLIVWLAKKVKE